MESDAGNLGSSSTLHWQICLEVIRQGGPSPGEVEEGRWLGGRIGPQARQMASPDPQAFHCCVEDLWELS